MIPEYVVDIIGDCVAEANTVLLAKLQAVDPTIVGINYQYGPPLEINETLMQMSKADTTQPKKYPLVALYMPIDEGSLVAGGDTQVPVRLIVARWSNKTDKASQRMAKNFKPILYPICYELLNQFALDTRIVSNGADTFGESKKIWPYWDDNTGKNPLIDWLDVIELNIKLTFNLKIC